VRAGFGPGFLLSLRNAFVECGGHAAAFARRAMPGARCAPRDAASAKHGFAGKGAGMACALQKGAMSGG